MNRYDHPDPDDLFADTRMTFGEHIEDLRNHLLRAIYGFVAGMVLAFFFAKPILGFIVEPVNRELLYFFVAEDQSRREEFERREKELGDIPPIRVKVRLRRPLDQVQAGKGEVFPRLTHQVVDWLDDLGIGFLVDREIVLKGEFGEVEEILFPNPAQLVGEIQRLQRQMNPPQLTVLSVQEPVVVFLKVAIMAGFVVSSPIVFWQIWAFIAAGLYPQEKRLVHVYLPFSLILFVAGVLVCQFIVIPKTVAALLWFNKWLNLQPDLRLNEWLGFAIFMPVVFGLSFQTPLVMLFTFMIGLFDVQTFKDKRKIAIISMAVFCALITPDTTSVSMMFMLVPMVLLYELGIWICIWKGREERDDWDSDEPHELVEV
jgi:sec-independent protein translocase protein TatC